MLTRSEHKENIQFGLEGVVTRVRTLLRAGRNAHLVRVEGRGLARFYVDGPDLDDRQDFFDLRAAVTVFEQVERGDGPRRL